MKQLRLRRVLQLALGKLFIATQDKAVVGNIRVVFAHAVDRERNLARIAAAVELIGAFDRRRLASVTRNIRQIVIWAGDYTAYDQWGGIHLASSHLAVLSPASLAGALVHEATHLRIWRAGIEYEASRRERIERRCVEEQADFLRRLPDGEEAAGEVLSDLENPWWTNRHISERVGRSLKRLD
jgi:hypothetical protein